MICYCVVVGLLLWEWLFDLGRSAGCGYCVGG